MKLEVVLSPRPRFQGRGGRRNLNHCRENVLSNALGPVFFPGSSSGRILSQTISTRNEEINFYFRSLFFFLMDFSPLLEMANSLTLLAKFFPPSSGAGVRDG